MKKYLILIAIVIINVSCVYGKQLPSFIKKCKRSDLEELNKCLLDRALFLKPYLVKGIPELKLPSIEPLHIPKFELHSGNGKSVDFNVILANVVAYGGKDLQVKEMGFDLDRKHIFIHLYIPDLKVQGYYSLYGKLLTLQLKSEGVGAINITDIHSKTDMNITILTRNNKEYIDLGDAYKIERKYGKISLYFEDLFKNNQQLTEETNKVLNDNVPELTKELDPLLDQSLHLLVIGIIKPLFDEFSIDELFDS